MTVLIDVTGWPLRKYSYGHLCQQMNILFFYVFAPETTSSTLMIKASQLARQESKVPERLAT